MPFEVAAPKTSDEVVAVDNHRNWQLRFFLIWTGQALSLIGSALTQFVLLWWITQTTGSASALATAGVMALLPQALLSPLGGVIADRWSRRSIMLLADLITALCMLVLIGLFASGNIQLWHVYTLMFIRSSMQAFQSPAATASTMMLVPSDWLPRVAGLNQALQGIMTIAAAPLGALALGFMPLQGALLIDVVTALLGITPLLFFTIPQRRDSESGATTVWAELRAGLTYVAHRRGLMMLLGLLGLIVMTIMPMFSLTPLLVKEHFQRGVNDVALMEGLSGVGIILGGLLIGLWSPFKRRMTTILLSFALSCLTIALVGLTPMHWFWLAVFWWFISGVTYSTGNAPMMAVIQQIVPNEMQGRIFALINTTVGLAAPIGLFIAGPVGESIGIAGLFILGGLLSTLVCLLGFLSPALLQIEEKRIV